jgi:hypothetical protein
MEIPPAGRRGSIGVVFAAVVLVAVCFPVSFTVPVPDPVLVGPVLVSPETVVLAAAEPVIVPVSEGTFDEAAAEASDVAADVGALVSGRMDVSGATVVDSGDLTISLLKH